MAGGGGDKHLISFFYLSIKCLFCLKLTFLKFCCSPVGIALHCNVVQILSEIERGSTGIGGVTKSPIVSQTVILKLCVWNIFPVIQR